MKKLLIILAVFLAFGTGAMAQTKTYVQAGVAVSNDIVYENVELGATTGKNRLAVMFETFTPGNDFTVDSNRQYFGGIKYTRGVAVGKKLDLLLSAAAKAQIDENLALSLEPGIGLGFNVGKGFSIIGTMSSPILQNTTPFKSLQLKAGLGIQIKI